MSLDAIWDEPIASPPKPAPADGISSPQKRPRQSLFLPDSDSDSERPPKRATPAPPPAKSDVDALFEDLDKEDDDDDDLRYKPLAPALDLEKLAKEAEARHAGARARQTGDGEKTGRKVLPRLDEERLVGSEGFPMLIEEIKAFKPKGKGNEHADLNRLLQVYQFWSHRMFPKMSFKDTVNRVEKLCHSKRMQVRLSVWRDEFKGITNDKRSEDRPLNTERGSSHTPSLPPASSKLDGDEFDFDAAIKAEGERLANLRAATADSELGRNSSTTIPEANAMDVDEASLWEALDDSLVIFNPPQTGSQLSIPTDNDEQEERSRRSEVQIPISRVNLIPSLASTNSGNASRATNDDDWDEMYS